jgi:serine/threonine-protein kinase
MAHVWAARHRTTGAVFALKMLLAHLAESDAFREMFFDEARIASRIHHENVARTYELIELEGRLTLVMEWVDGSSLVQLLRLAGASDDAPRVALPIRVAVRILADTCAGLHAAHELLGEDGLPLAVVHRDVSPHNILLTRDGRVKVTDFGVAKAIGKSHMTIAGQVKGKLAYMSPEQLVGGGIDRRSDVFALGGVLYETTTGERPFQGEHDPQVMTAIVMGNLRPPSEIVPGYPRALEEIILRALASEPDGRFATALQMKEALEAWLASSGPPVGPPHVAARLQERCGAELAVRQGAVVSATAPAPPFVPRPSPDAAEPGSRRARGSALEGVSTIGVILAMLGGALLGLVVLFFVKAARSERRVAALAVDAAATAASPTVPVAKAAPPASASAPTVATPDASEAEPEPDAAVLASTDVILHLPVGAHMIVDGRDLPPGSNSVPRPASGVVKILVRAEGREDTYLEVRPTSPDDVVVTMKKKPPPPPAPSATEERSASPVLAPNPYE